MEDKIRDDLDPKVLPTCTCESQNLNYPQKVRKGPCDNLGHKKQNIYILSNKIPNQLDQNSSNDERDPSHHLRQCAHLIPLLNHKFKLRLAAHSRIPPTIRSKVAREYTERETDSQALWVKIPKSHDRSWRRKACFALGKTTFRRLYRCPIPDILITWQLA
jgi:hypothetical protein